MDRPAKPRKSGIRPFTRSVLRLQNFFRHFNPWFLPEIVKTPHPRHKWRKRCRNLWVAGVCPVLFPVHGIFVDRGMQRFFDLTFRARELADAASVGAPI